MRNYKLDNLGYPLKKNYKNRCPNKHFKMKMKAVRCASSMKNQFQKIR